MVPWPSQAKWYLGGPEGYLPQKCERPELLEPLIMGMEAPVPQDDKQRPNDRTFVFRAPEELDGRPAQKRIATNNMQSRTILITGGAGFIGSHLIRLFVNKYPH